MTDKQQFHREATEWPWEIEAPSGCTHAFNNIPNEPYGICPVELSNARRAVAYLLERRDTVGAH